MQVIPKLNTVIMIAEEFMDENPRRWWYMNVKGFTKDTTLHGIKFIFADSKYWIRKRVYYQILFINYLK